MDTEAQGAPPAEGAEPAVQPAAEAPPVEKTPEQLEAEKKTADEAAEKEAEEAEEQAVKKKPWFQRRIDEVTKARREAEARADRLERMVDRLTQQRGQPPPEPLPAQLPAETIQPTRPRPTREQFDFDEDKYVEAVADWKYEQREAQMAHKARQQEQQKTVQTFQQEFETRKANIRKEGAEKYPDFNEAIDSVPGEIFNEETAFIISMVTEAPPDVAYHLAKNPAEAERIAKLPPLVKAYELGKLQSSISNRQPRTPKAPPPINPVGGKEPARVKEDDLPIQEWLKRRNAGQITGRG